MADGAEVIVGWLYIVVDVVLVQPVELGLAAVIVTVSEPVLLLRAGMVTVFEAVGLEAEKVPLAELDQLVANPVAKLEITCALLLQ